MRKTELEKLSIKRLKELERAEEDYLRNRGKPERPFVIYGIVLTFLSFLVDKEVASVLVAGAIASYIIAALYLIPVVVHLRRAIKLLDVLNYKLQRQLEEIHNAHTDA